MAQLSYNEVISAIQNYYNNNLYGTNLSWVEVSKSLANAGVTTDNYYKVLDTYPDLFTVYRNADGSIRDVTVNTYASSQVKVGNPLDGVDSNASTALSKTATQLTVPSVTKVSTTGQLEISSGIGLAKETGVTVSGVLSTVSTGLACVGVGATLGKVIDGVLYNANPDFWDSHGMGELNPDTWDSITSDAGDGFGTRVINTLFGLDPDSGEATQYIDETALAYIAYYMQSKGAFTDKGVVSPLNINPLTQPLTPVTYPTTTLYNDTHDPTVSYAISYPSTSWKKQIIIPIDSNNKMPVRYYYQVYASDIAPTSERYQEYTYNGKTVYRTGINSSSYYYITRFVPQYDTVISSTSVLSTNMLNKIAWTIMYGETVGSVDGITTQDGATTPTLTSATSVDEALTLLKEQYPQLWEQSVTKEVLQEDGSTRTYTYVPMSSGEINSDGQPVTGGATQSQTAVNPDTATAELLQTLIDQMTHGDTDIKTPDTGTGSTPEVVIPTGTASSLYKIYNPTQSEVDSFGAWLWSPSFVDQVLKLFSDPMQAIIGLHKVYSPVPVGGTESIKVGYLDSGVSSNWVSNQYVDVDCGSVQLPEFFGNVFDYDPYTKVYLYLPFVGIHQLNTGDVMRSSLGVKYHVDVITGACLVDISVSRDGAGGVLYTYNGNCAVQYPVSSGSYMGIVTSVATIAGSVAGAVATGGALTPVALGSLSTLSHAHTAVSHSGNFSGNAGAMGCKKPYLIITRPQTQLAESFPTLVGYPVNHAVTIGSCSGYIVVDSCRLDGITATEEELRQIESLLKSGVIV